MEHAVLAASPNLLRSSGVRWPDCGGFFAPPSRPQTRASIDASGTNERFDGNGASSAHAFGFARSGPEPVRDRVDT